VCDKIGVSYAAFQNDQPNRCAVLPKSCIQNQPVHFYAQDVELEQLGERPEYLLRGLGDFEEVIDKENQRYLSMRLDQIQASVVTLEVAADNIRYITSVSPGRILEAYVDEFEAQSRNGLLRVHVTNVGGITAEFLLTVTECSANIQPVLAKSMSLYGAAKAWISFNIYSETQLGTDNQCTGKLDSCQSSALACVAFHSHLHLFCCVAV
jgi:Male gamete fusion factor